MLQYIEITVKIVEIINTEKQTLHGNRLRQQSVAMKGLRKTSPKMLQVIAILCLGVLIGCSVIQDGTS